jgi:hypothetical protein
MTPETFTEAMKDKEFSQGYLEWIVFLGWPHEERENNEDDVLQEQSEYGVTPDKGEYDGCD